MEQNQKLDAAKEELKKMVETSGAKTDLEKNKILDHPKAKKLMDMIYREWD